MKNRIRVLRAEIGWSQAKLAEAVKIARQSLNAIENEKHAPSVSLAFAIAAALGRRIEDVFITED
jgi:putative transcriptional regulator